MAIAPLAVRSPAKTTICPSSLIPGAGPRLFHVRAFGSPEVEASVVAFRRMSPVLPDPLRTTKLPPSDASGRNPPPERGVTTVAALPEPE
jgi:hypothetical protein